MPEDGKGGVPDPTSHCLMGGRYAKKWFQCSGTGAIVSLFIYFERDRESVSRRKVGGGADFKQALCMVSTEPDMGLEPVKL